MAKARIEFLRRLHAAEGVLTGAQLQNRGLSDRHHNEGARLLRNGLMVVGVAALEDFVRGRTAEALDHISASGVPFRSLPEKLRSAATVEAMTNTAKHMSRIWRTFGEDLIARFQDIAAQISSTTGPGYVLSEFALGHGSSNLNAETLKQIAGAFGLTDAWGQIRMVAGRVGLSAPDHKEAFTQAIRTRHRAAHDANAQTEPTDLEAFIRHAKGIAVSFDGLVSRAARLIGEGDTQFLTAPSAIHQSIGVRFLDQGRDGYWREHAEGARTYRRSTDRDSLLADVVSRARVSRSLVVVRDSSQTPLNWVSTDVP